MAVPQHDERRGIEAEQLLRNELLQEAFRTVEARIVGQLSRLDLPREQVERLQLALAMGRKYQDYLRQVAVTGELVMQEHRQQEKRKAVTGLEGLWARVRS